MLFTSVLLTALCGAELSSQWPAFQGVGASELNADTIPLTWTPTANIAWKCVLPGRGQSSPVVWGDLAFVTAIDGSMKERCRVVAIRLADGKIAWQQELAATQQIRSNYFQSRSAPTPVVDADRVYVFFETGELAAFTHDGKQVWRRSLTADYGEFEGTIGIAASPIQTADALILLVDHEGPSYLASIDNRTGETRWQTERTSRVSWATPALVTVGDRQQIVCSSAGTIDGYDPETGKELWTFDGVGGNRHSTPLPIGPGRFLVGASPGMHGEKELEARKSNFAMQIETASEGFKPKIVWSSDKAMPSFGSPIVHRGHAYWVNKVGVVYCFDAETGEQRYAQRIKQSCWVTPVGIGDRLYCFGKDGVTTVLATGPEFKVLAENSLWDGAYETPQRADRQSTGSNPPAPGGRMFADPIQYGVAAVNGSLLIRTGEVVYCVRAGAASQ